MAHVKRYGPWIVVSAAVLYLIAMMSPMDAPAKAMDFTAFGKLPVQHAGRIKPMDTLARVYLLLISNRQTYYDKDDKEHSATEWLVNVLASPYKQREHPSAEIRAFKIELQSLRDYFGAETRTDSLYSYNELKPKVLDFMREVSNRASQLADARPSDEDMAYFELYDEFMAYARLAQYETPYRVFRIDNHQVLALLGLQPRAGFRYSIEEFSPRMAQLNKEGRRASKIPDKEQSAYDAKVAQTLKRLLMYVGLASLQLDELQVIPPTSANEEWRGYADAADEAKSTKNPSEALVGFTSVLFAAANDDAAGFNKQVASYSKQTEESLGGTKLIRFEAFFNHFEPFYQCMLLYGAIFVLACASWIGWSGPLGRTAFWLCVLTLAVHAAALVARCFIQGRPPVTNLYSSAVFVGSICVVLGLLLERFFPYAIASAAAALLGLTTALLAHHLAEEGDTMIMLQAVLDTNFWLATHVVAVTIGYGATLFAGFLGAAFVIKGVLTTGLTSQVLKDVTAMIYGIVCFATLFSFTGTVLGGIWADYSWGRFWGWDPKENGALVIVIWNALILHARWAGMVKQRGMAVLSVVGVMVTIWSWIGTNQLGVGLHAYGFSNTLAVIAVVTWAICLMVIAVGLIPLKHWRSFQQAASTVPPAKAPSKPRLQPT
jgi:ABC-type transport system involved in cytochrome c biogenesis permease subunit